MFRGRVRARVLAGLLIVLVALAYGTWSTRRFGMRGSERSTFDQPLVEMAGRLVRRPDSIPNLHVKTSTEVELAALARDQQDLLFGMTVLLLRLLVTGTVGGLGLILLTAGSTEWEIRSESAAGASAPAAPFRIRNSE